MIHDHSFAFQHHADPPPLGDCVPSPASQWIAKPTPLAGNRLLLFANFWIIPLSADASIAERGQACTHNVARCHDLALPCAPQPVAHSVSSILSQQILQHNMVQHRVRQKPLQLGILIFKRFKARRLRNGHSRSCQCITCRTAHPAILGFELVQRRRTEAMPAAHLSSWHPSLRLLNHPPSRDIAAQYSARQ